MPQTTPEFVIPFERLGRGDVARVGGKNASLGEMVAQLGARGVRVPPGFATTAQDLSSMRQRYGASSATTCRLARPRTPPAPTRSSLKVSPSWPDGPPLRPPRRRRDAILERLQAS